MRKLFGILLVVALVLSFSIVATTPVAAAYDVVEGQSIQAAIDVAAPGAIITVGPGTYDENLSIDKSLSLIGAGRDVTTVQAIQGRNYNGGGFQSPIVGIEGDAALLNLQPIEIDAPAAISGAKDGSLAAFGPAPGDAGWAVSGEVVYADPPLGDDDIGNVDGKIALIDRGAVAFSIKAHNSQEGGAIGVIIANTSDDLITMGAGDYADQITIPVIMIRKSDADAIKAELDEETVIATFQDDVYGPGGVTISGFTFKGNIPATPQSGINGLSTQGIETSDPWPWPARQNIVITDNAFVFCGKAAVLYNVTGFEVRNNIAIRESHGGQIIGGGIFHNSGGGGFGFIADNIGFDPDSTISVTSSSHIEISGNVIEAPETPVEGDLDIVQHAITVHTGGSSIDIVGNTISGLKAGPKSGYTHGWQGAGVSLNNVNNARVEGNTFENNTIGVRVQVGTATQPPVIRCNSFLGNFFSVFNHTGGIGPASVEVDAHNNYWGTADGPTVVSVADFGANTWAGFYALLDDADHPDHAVSDKVDFDRWLPTELVEPLSVETTTGTGLASFMPSQGALEELQALADLPPEPPEDVTFPHGMFEFQICCLTPGQTVTVTIELPEDVPMGYVWWKYQDGEWYWLPNETDDGDNIMTITLVDGGLGDADGVADGFIRDPGGPGNPEPDPDPAPIAVGWEGSGVDKVAVMAPWIALFAAMIAGATLFVVRRRGARI